jgi:uncharacterized RDD family membrane protein YckC
MISLDKARIHRVLTPEGLSLPFVVAPAGDRLSAFLFDTLLIAGATILAWGLAALSSLVGMAELGFSFAVLAGFLLWNFYFIYFEVHWGGVTVGKRRAGLRVISRDGGPLTAEAIFARNILRDLEFYIPVMVLLAPDQMLPEAPGWGRLLAAVWFLVFALMPLFNEDRLRCGDMVAGTMVVKAPAAVLLSDLTVRGSDRPAATAPAPPPPEEFPFTRQQLDIYGIHELQVLEDLLRRDDQGILEGRILEEVCDKIKTKIGWPRERWDVPPRRFLDAFYRAQRGLLEQKMLFGQRQERKRG